MTNTTGHSVNVGYEAGWLNTTGHSINIGYYAGRSNTTGHSVNIGYQAGQGNVVGNSVNIGYRAGVVGTSHSVNIGYQAGEYKTSGIGIHIGYQAGVGVTSTNAPATDTSGILIGTQANRSVPTATVLANYIGIGYGTLVDKSNQVKIGNSSIVETVLFGDIFPGQDNVYYLGKNDDDTPFAWKGLILKDTTNGKYYRIECINGVITATDLTD